MAIRVAWFIAALTFLPLTASAQTPDNILLVVNSDSTASTQIAEHYIQVRKVPDRNVVRVHTVETEGAFRNAVRDACYIEQTQGQRQKLNYAERLGFAAEAFVFGADEEPETAGIEWSGSASVLEMLRAGIGSEK